MFLAGTDTFSNDISVPCGASSKPNTVRGLLIFIPGVLMSKNLNIFLMVGEEVGQNLAG